MTSARYEAPHYTVLSSLVSEEKHFFSIRKTNSILDRICSADLIYWWRNEERKQRKESWKCILLI